MTQKVVIFVQNPHYLEHFLHLIQDQDNKISELIGPYDQGGDESSAIASSESLV
jgi:hypothetical protein